MGLYSGARNAMPPSSRAESDSVLTAKPLAPTFTSTPLTFQNRVFSVTYTSLGALTNTSMLTPLPSASRA
ncbi:hypothetical protein D3C84_1126150 [compost metagenome]